MEKMVIHRDRQELQAADLNNMQAYARSALDHIVLDGIADGNWYTGFTVSKTGDTQVTVDPGRFYSDGKVYAEENSNVLSLYNVLPVSQLKKVLITISKSTVDTNVEPRDFLIDVEEGTTEPDSVAMQSLRKATVNQSAGSEAASPTIPATPADQVAVAVVTLNSSGVQSVQMLTENLLPQARRNYESILDQVLWRNRVGAQVDGLRTDLASLAAKLRGYASLDAFATLLGMIQETREIAENALSIANTPDWLLSAHDWLLDNSTSDEAYSGYDARVEEGIRFPYDTTETSALALFNANDPDVLVVNNFMLPKYTHSLRLDIPTYDAEHRISSYSSTTFDLVVKYRSRTRIRYGDERNWCTNQLFYGSRAQNVTFDYEANTFTIGAETWEVMDGTDLRELHENYETRQGRWHMFFRAKQFWVDEQQEPYTERVVNEVQVSGQGCAESFLVSQPQWLTQIGLFFSRKGASGDVNVIICECPDGVRPSLQHVVARTTLDFDDIQVGSGFEGGGLPNLVETKVPLEPTYLVPGRRYAVVLLTGGDHYVALGSDSKDRTVGDFWFAENNLLHLHPTARDKDMKMRLYTAYFDSVSVEVDLNSVTVAGGVESIDILADQFTPPGTSFRFEVNIGGTWYPLTDPLPGVQAANLQTGQSVVQLRAKFQGTRDLMPALGLGSSRSTVVMANLATDLKWASEIQDVGAGNTTENIKVRLRLEYFDDAHHTCTIKINAIGGSLETADSVEDVVQSDGTVMRTATFALAAPCQQFQVEVTGDTDNAAILYHVAEMYVYAAV